MTKYVGLAALAVGASCASAELIRFDTGPFSSGSGGEFVATPISGFLGLTGLPADLTPDTFETFCMETSEQFQPGTIYDGALNTGAIMGSVGGFDPIDDRTAFLYTNFRYGTLAGFDYGAGRQASAADLQNAIWFIEGEGGANNAFVALADAAVSSFAWAGLGDVRVINVMDEAGNLKQDQLTLVPAPGALGLVGLTGLLVSRRRR